MVTVWQIVRRSSDNCLVIDEIKIFWTSADSKTYFAKETYTKLSASRGDQLLLSFSRPTPKQQIKYIKIYSIHTHNHT